MIVVHKRLSWNIKDFCEWDFCHWAVHNVDADHKAIIVVLDLLGVRHFVIEIQKCAVPDGLLRGYSDSECLLRSSYVGTQRTRKNLKSQS